MFLVAAAAATYASTSNAPAPAPAMSVPEATPEQLVNGQEASP